jgi:hypothetical protein
VPWLDLLGGLCWYPDARIHRETAVVSDDADGCVSQSHNVGWVDVVERYRRLAALYREIGFDDEAVWIDRRL